MALRQIAVVGLVAAVAVAAALAVLKSGGKESLAAPTIRIQRIEPPGEVPLVAGDTATFRVTARAHHVGAGHWIGLVVQADGVALANGGPVEAIDGGDVTLLASVRVPNAASLQVFTPLFREGQGETRRMDMRSYKIVAAREQGR